MKQVKSLLITTLTSSLLFLGASCSQQKEEVTIDPYIWRGVLNHNPIAPNPNVIYRELPEENWVYFSKRSSSFYLYTGVDWIVLDKKMANSMVDSLNTHKTSKLKSLL